MDERLKTAMSTKPWMPPFLLALAGVASDYLTTTIGLAMGFCETNLHYHPFWALLFFWGAIAMLTLTLHGKRNWNQAVKVPVLLSFLGAANNALVLLGLFSGF